MSSFTEADDASIAWCERPADWKPEHSLSRDFGAKAEFGQSITIQVTEGLTDRWVHGLVDGQVVVSFLRPSKTGSWSRISYDNTKIPLRMVVACEEATYRHVVELSRVLAGEEEGAELVVTFEPSEGEERTRLPF